MGIIEIIIENSKELYMPYALMADPLDGNLFCSLLIGPCTLDFTRIKSVNDFWSDPNADELINRYNIADNMRRSSILNSETNSPSRVVLRRNKKLISHQKEYVESIHQNNKSQLIYGKNNILVNQVNFLKLI